MKINSFGTDTLVELNRWIEEHPNIRIINIETVLTNIRPAWRKSYYIWYEEIDQASNKAVIDTNILESEEGADVLSKDITSSMVGYVIKDMDGEIRLFTDKPRKNYIRGWWESTSFHASSSLDEKSLPLEINPSWDDEMPIKVRIKLNRL